MKNSLKTILSLGLVTALGTGGTILIANAQDNSPAATRDARVAQTVEREANEGDDDDDDDAREMAQYEALATITAEQAKQKAEAAQGETATKVELDEEDGSLVYEVEFANNTEVLVDAGNGEILKTELEGEEENEATETPIRGSIQVPEDAEDADEAREMAQYEALATITAEQAKQKAEAAQGETATKVKLDEEDGSLVYEVEFANETEVYVDAGNGEILRTELENDNDAVETPIRGSIQVPAEAGKKGENKR